MIVSRALITSLSNSSAFIPVSISFDKLPRVNARVATGCGVAEENIEVGTKRGVAVDRSTERLGV